MHSTAAEGRQSSGKPSDLSSAQHDMHVCGACSWKQWRLSWSMSAGRAEPGSSAISLLSSASADKSPTCRYKFPPSKTHTHILLITTKLIVLRAFRSVQCAYSCGEVRAVDGPPLDDRAAAGKHCAMRHDVGSAIWSATPTTVHKTIASHVKLIWWQW